MKTIKSIRKWRIAPLALVLLLALIPTISTQAAKAPCHDWRIKKTKISGDWVYGEVTGGIMIVGYNGKGSNVIIPSKIAGKTVTMVGNCSINGEGGDPHSPEGYSILFHKTSVKSITIPKSVKKIHPNAFSHHSLKEIKVDSNNPNYTSVDGILFNKKKTSLIQYPAGKPNRTYTIPKSVKTIAQEAFFDCKSLEKVTIGNGVTVIKGSAFYKCTSLKSIIIGKNVKTIENKAFFYCKSLTSITIPDNVRKIEPFTFNFCMKLNKITIGKGLKTIDAYAFSYGGSYCKSLRTIKINAKNPNFTSVNDVLFNKQKTKLIYYPTGKPSKKYRIPNGVKTIGHDAFLNCKSITSLTIPESVTKINDNAFEFYNKKKLTMYCKEGSYSHKYAKQNGYKFVLR